MNSTRTGILLQGIVLGILAVCISVPPVNAQGETQPENAGRRVLADPSASPPATVPNNADIKCAIVEWNPDASTPKLTLLCPPLEVFAPLRVYLTLSWEKPEQVPRDYRKIIASPKTPTKMRSTRKGVFVWLKVQRNHEGEPPVRWVSFNYLVGIGLQPNSGSR